MARRLLAAYRPVNCRQIFSGAADGERAMAIEIRKTLVWATAAAAIVSAVLLAASGASLPRADPAPHAGSSGAAQTAPAH